MAEDTVNPGADNARQVVLQKIYVKDASLEVPLAPVVFTRQWQPAVEVQVNTDVKPVQGESYNVVLSITVTAKLGDDVAFLCEVQQAGIFAIRGFEGADRAAVLGGYCPGLIFPFARESIADLVQRGGFPQFLLQPINFEQLYLEHQSRAAEAAAAKASAPPTVTAH